MRIAVIPIVILAFALVALLYVPAPMLEISVSELENGVRIENTGNIDCIVFVTSVGDEQRFELDVGQSTVIIGITKPIDVSAVSK